MNQKNHASDRHLAERTAGAESVPLLLTKLYRPPVTPDLEQRTRLVERLERNRHRPLTLISAPAGYGKTMLATRSDPPLPLPQLRAMGEMTEFRFVDLRFTPQETDTFLQGAVGREVSAETAGLLAERAEGWIVGLRLAALSMSVLSDDEAFAQRFKGRSSALIVEYLLSEVLARQSSEIQDFALLPHRHRPFEPRRRAGGLTPGHRGQPAPLFI